MREFRIYVMEVNPRRKSFASGLKSSLLNSSYRSFDEQRGQFWVSFLRFPDDRSYEALA